MFRQPVSRVEIEAICGVRVGPMLRSLRDCKLVKVVGRADVPGAAAALPDDAAVPGALRSVGADRPAQPQGVQGAVGVSQALRDIRRAIPIAAGYRIGIRLPEERKSQLPVPRLRSCIVRPARAICT